MANEKELIEALSDLEHEQWIAWSKDIAKTEDINKKRHERWKKLWIPYNELSEKDKEKDREWARKILKIIKDKGVSIMRTRLTKVAKVVSELDSVANEIQPQNEKLAMAIDHISDGIEKKAFSPQGWLPGRGLGPGFGRGYGMGWTPGTRFKVNEPGKKPDPGAVNLFCTACGERVRRFGSVTTMPCPRCGSPMTRY